jgi:3-hydroxybutyryl-CoA dehydrogenase
MVDILKTVAVLGTGVIGRSWIALFAASGLAVRVHDLRKEAEDDVRQFWSDVQPTLVELGLRCAKSNPEIRFFGSAAEAVATAELVQECVPERLPIKQTLFREIEPALSPNAIVATSSSGFLLSDLQRAWDDPGKLIIAHPFNPPHIIPLVELYANERTAAGIVERARQFYEHCRKTTILLKKEVPAHVANRLQAALWREAIHLVNEGVVSVKDVDVAVSTGPGLRWAVMGPHMLLNLGGGSDGLRAYCEQFRDSYHAWWKDLGEPKITADTVSKLVQGLQEEIGGRDYEALCWERDAKLVAAIRAIGNVKPYLPL